MRACIAAGAVVATLCFGDKRGKKIRRMTVGQILEVLKECGPSVKFAVAARPEIAGLKQANVTAAVVMLHMVDAEICEKFCAKLMKGENLSGDDPVLILRNFLLTKAGAPACRSWPGGCGEDRRHRVRGRQGRDGPGDQSEGAGVVQGPAAGPGGADRGGLRAFDQGRRSHARCGTGDKGRGDSGGRHGRAIAAFPGEDRDDGGKTFWDRESYFT